ncbi:putative Ig domain-containing protein [Micromonospora sp. NPDC006431]|uniref:putative Ig domain-containing protein n=1 Tax=Micromonospora sp. NPDC006431 TaxID=3364235 RepID=UPI0036823F16
MSALLLVLLGTAQPAAAATITITSGPPASPVAAYESYPPHTFTASGGTAPYTLSLRSGSLPAGMALSSSGVFSGTPTTPGSYSFGVRMTDTDGFFADQDVTVVVVAPTITITSGAPTSPVTAYEPYPAHTFTASGGAGPYTLSLRSGSLPAGMALSSSGVFSGTPTTPGSYSFGVRMTDTHGFYADQDVTVVVVAPTITITSGTPTSPWYTGQAYPPHTFTASGGADPYSLSLRSGSLPAGMALSSSGVFSGTPTTPGSYSFGVRMTDTHGFYADQDITVVIADPATTITSGEPHRGTVGEGYSFRFTATGDSNIKFSVTAGDLPDGLTLAPDGGLSGTPEAEGSFTFTVKATGTASSATDEVTLVIDAAPSSPSPTPTSSASPSSPSPSATAGPGLPVTGSDTRTMLLLGVAVIAVGGMLLLLAYERRRRSLTRG